jgi:hypothetical protein
MGRLIDGYQEQLITLEELRSALASCADARPRPKHSSTRGDLGDDVDAVAIVGEHLLDPAYLPLDPVHALDQRLLVGGVAVGRCRSAVGQLVSLGDWKRLSLSELVTTKTLEKDIYAAAMIGSSSPAIARGIAATL